MRHVERDAGGKRERRQEKGERSEHDTGQEKSETFNVERERERERDKKSRFGFNRGACLFLFLRVTLGLLFESVIGYVVQE